MKTELTPKQERFCQEYARIGKANAAYKIAYDSSNMAPDTINCKASQLLKHGKIRDRINEIMQEYAKKYSADKDNVVRTLLNIINVSIDDFFVEEETDDGKTKKTKRRLRNIEELSPRAKEAIKLISNNRGKVTYQFYDKMDAIRQLCSIMGWEKDKTININSRQYNTLRIGFESEEE